jgi:hypothetical protein
MKKPFFFSLLILFSAQAFSQEIIPLQKCENARLQQQADSIKQVLTSQGFVVLREASVSMESEYEQPVVVPMQAGGLYFFAFIGDPASNLFEVRMYDWEEREVVYKKNKRDLDGNLIAFDYVPKGTEYHMFKPLQVNKKQKKGLCGYVLLLKKVK